MFKILNSEIVSLWSPALPATPAIIAAVVAITSARPCASPPRPHTTELSPDIIVSLQNAVSNYHNTSLFEMAL
jgi:hypothetical protein